MEINNSIRLRTDDMTEGTAPDHGANGAIHPDNARACEYNTLGKSNGKAAAPADLKHNRNQPEKETGRNERSPEDPIDIDVCRWACAP